jgi:hypothetical protein
VPAALHVCHRILSHPISSIPSSGKYHVLISTTEILVLRKGMWEKVSSRSHNPMKIFPFGSYSDELMLHGTVKYEMKAGGEKELDWAARVHLVKVDGKVKMDFYQVYLVSQSSFPRFATWGVGARACSCPMWG